MSARPMVVVTREEGPEASLSGWLKAGGLEVFFLPTISIQPPSDGRPLEEALQELSGFDWLAFTSAHAVEALCRRPGWPRAWAAAARRPRLAVVGPATAAALFGCGLLADLQPAEAGARALAAALLAAAEGRPLRVLWPRSDLARPELREALTAGGARVVDPVAYQTGSAPPAPVAEFSRLLDEGRIAAVCFLSPSSATNLAAILGGADLAHLSGRTRIASIGPTTSAALKSLGAPPDLEAAERSARNLAQALVLLLSPQQGVAP
ncbi:MAG TPA: uroporphyrinogen-III synthase [Vicinamibacteria bacterium]|jgi:uroporphyrinogen-III synthase|nr:uroporphyrinogen-III synthase [Vicinamibacteria bacterium]